MEANGRITDFNEKPKMPENRKGFEVESTKNYYASMGVYVFKARVLTELLAGDEIDFGREIIPKAIKNKHLKSFGYYFDGYWRDIGTIRSFYEACLELTGPYPKFRFHSPKGNIFTHPRFLPPSQILGSKIDNSLISEGTVIRHATIEDSIIGLREVIHKKASIKKSVIMGADFFEFESLSKNKIPMGIGDGTKIEGAIIDKNVRIGRHVIIKNAKKLEDFDGDNYFIREGIVIVPKDAVIADSTVI